MSNSADNFAELLRQTAGFGYSDVRLRDEMIRDA